MGVKQLFDLSGRTAIVTGGSRGLGLQIAEALGEMGASVALTARKKDELDKAVASLAAAGVNASAWPCDLGSREAIGPVAAAIIGRHGKVDILVNNAGANWAAPAEEFPADAWDKVVNLNLNGLFALSQAIAKHSMLPQGWGRIINVASVNGLIANDARIVKTAAYTATKHAIVGLTRQLAAEWAARGVTVNAICPGFFSSKMTRGLLSSPAGKLILDGTPSGRLGGDEDLKGLAVLLASEAGRHINGQAIAVDGGAMIV